MAYGSQGIYTGLLGQPTNVLTIQAGQAYNVPPGSWTPVLDSTLTLQYFDIVTQSWRSFGLDSPGLKYVNSDGNNWRVVNTTGCMVGASVTTAGSGYSTSSPPTIAVSAGGAKAFPIIGGALSTTITVTNGGTNYIYPPTVVIQAPGNGATTSTNGAGLPATAYSTLSGTAVSTVTVVNQGAGYATVPQITFINDPRDTTGSGAQAVASLTGSGTVTGVLVTDFGNPQTAVPTLTFSSGSAAATAIMDFTATGLTLTNAGSGYTHSSTVRIESVGGLVTASAILNPAYTTGLVRISQCILATTTNSSGVLQAGSVILAPGRFQSIPPLVIVDGLIVGGPVTTAAVIALTVGGTNGTLLLYPNPL